MLAVQYAQHYPSSSSERTSSASRASRPSVPRAASASSSSSSSHSRTFSASSSSTTSRHTPSRSIETSRLPPTPVQAPVAAIPSTHASSSNSNSAAVTAPSTTTTTTSRSSLASPIKTEALIDIERFPANDLLHLLASLLGQIATQNDKLSATSFNDPSGEAHDPNSQRTMRRPSMSQRNNLAGSGLYTAAKECLSGRHILMSFHARNVPSITLDAYLARILKYCPAPNEVFLSLLVYFDRMAAMTEGEFVIDSWNVHRLVIAGVTVASKFFSDVFYTNSRYAKVGGISQPELNQLELQFLFLNNFKLVISENELQSYARQLIQFSSPRTPSVGPSPDSSFSHSRTSTDESMDTETDDDSTIHASTVNSAASSTSFLADSGNENA